MKNCKEMVNSKFGKLTVLKRDYSRGIKNGKHNKIFLLCKCECGNKTSVDKFYLTSGATKSCGCLHSKIISERNKNNALPGGESALRGLYSSYKRSAFVANKPFELTLDQFRTLTKSNCAYCGCKPTSVRKSNRGQIGDYIYNGIDRVDSNDGYVIDNCVPACKRCNQAKNDMNIKDFSKWLTRVYFFSFGGAK